VQSDFGIAKTNLIEAEFQIDTYSSSGTMVEYDPQRIIEMIQDALVIFEKIRYEHLVARCLRNFAELQLQNNVYDEAKKHIEKSIIILK